MIPLWVLYTAYAISVVAGIAILSMLAWHYAGLLLRRRGNEATADRQLES